MKSVADFRKLAALARTDDELMDVYYECVDGHEVGNIGRFNQVLIEHKERISLLADFEFLKVKEQINKDDPQDKPKEKPIRRKPEPKKIILTPDDMPVSDKSEARFFDHLGNGFKSLGACAHYYGFEEHQLRNRLHRGASLKDALTLPVNCGHKFKFCPQPPEGKYTPRTDHEGRKFDSFKELAAFYGMSANGVQLRLKRGWSLKDALLTPSRRYNRK